MRISDWSSDVCSSDLALHLGRRENLAGGVRRIVSGGDAEGEMDQLLPVLLRNEVVLAIGTVGVGVDQAGDGRLAGDVDLLGAGGNVHRPSRADCAAAVEIGRASCRERVCQYV